LTRTFTVYSWTVKREQDHQFAEAWKDFAKWVTHQMGSLGSTRLFRDLDNLGHFLSVDSWESEESLKILMKGTEYGHRVEALQKFLDSFSSWPLKLEAEERNLTQ
jgi:quinol monooxygenase YgiN